MIGDNVIIKQHHITPAKEIFQRIKVKLTDKYSIAIGGESGCGKSTLALALKQILEEHGYNVFIFHMDDYFFLPPKSNHEQRLEDISNVGPQEVNLHLLQSHIEGFKNGAQTIVKPLVYYTENEIKTEEVAISLCDVLLVEGTYTLGLEVDLKIFLERNYHDTLQNRIDRARDPLSSFVESVLEIEHKIIAAYAKDAQILVDKSYGIKFCQ